MKFHQISFLALAFSCFFFVCAVKHLSVVPLGSEWGLGMFPQSMVIQRLLPSISFMKAKNIQAIAKQVVKRDDFRQIYENLEECQFKVELRRQYYLANNGDMLDDFPINFSVKELHDAGMLAQSIENCKNSGVLDLSGKRISDLYGLSSVVEKVAKIIELNLSNNFLTEMRGDDFPAYFSQLIRLDISYNSIILLEEHCFDYLVSLQFLDLGNNRIVSIPDYLFSQLFALQALDLSDNKIARLGKHALFGLEKNLKKLSLADNGLKKIDSGVLKWIKTLQDYDLDGNNL